MLSLWKVSKTSGVFEHTKNSLLEFFSVCKSFGGVKAVDGCTFSVGNNTITSLIGPNGAGKTTIFNIISGLTKPDYGKIKLLDSEITGLPAYKIAQAGISRTFQLTKVFRNMTIRDNLLIAKKASDGEMKSALARVHLHKPLDMAAGELSYGQQRLLEIARAVLREHKLLALDEPTAGVNPQIRQELKAILRGLKEKGNTVLLIEHDMEFVMNISDEVIVLNEGRVLKRGKPQDIVKDKEVLEAYLGK
ncbi:ABC transporter ATP-binding protein [Candidatus Woesearchaeota archaeon]|nr:ABC transporter ATP-binding protein [Candidatus Woesearchaeota archaeon]